MPSCRPSYVSDVAEEEGSCYYDGYDYHEEDVPGRSEGSLNRQCGQILVLCEQVLDDLRWLLSVLLELLRGLDERVDGLALENVLVNIEYCGLVD